MSTDPELRAMAAMMKESRAKLRSGDSEKLYTQASHSIQTMSTHEERHLARRQTTTLAARCFSASLFSFVCLALTSLAGFVIASGFFAGVTISLLCIALFSGFGRIDP